MSFVVSPILSSVSSPVSGVIGVGASAIHAVIGDSIALGFNNGDPSAPYDEVVANSLLWTGSQFEALQGGVNNQSHGTGTGIVVGLGNQLAVLQGKHYMVEHCVSGSALAVGWQTPAGANYADYKTKMDAAIAAAPGGTKFKSVTIALGTNDSDDQAEANAVKANYEALIAQIKSDYAAYLHPNFTVCVVQVGDASGYNWIEAAKFFERQVESIASNDAVLIKTEGYAQWDSVHYTAAATIDIGIAAANAIHTNTSEVYQPSYDIAANASVVAWWNGDGVDANWVGAGNASGPCEIEVWPDYAADAYDLTSPSAAERGRWAEAVENNQAMVQFTSERATTTISSLSAPFAIALAFRPISNTSRRYMVSIGSNAADHISITHNANALSLFNGSTATSGGTTLTNGEMYVIWVECGTGTISARVNGATDSQTISDTVNPNGTLWIGDYAAGAGTPRSDFYIGDVIIMSAVPSTTVRDAIEAELATKWGVTLA